MKWSIAIVLLSATWTFTFQNDELAKKLREVKRECIKVAGIQEDSADKSMKGDFSDSKENKCFIKCMFVKFGYMTEAGVLNEDFIKSHPRPGDDSAKLAATVEKCKNPAGNDACERAYNFAKCAQADL